MTRRAVALLVLASVLACGLVVGLMEASSPRRPVSELEYVTAQAGDSYFRIAAQHQLACTGTQLYAANGRAVLDPGTIVLIPPSCRPGATTTTEVASSTTVTIPTPSTSTTSSTVASTTSAPTTTATSTTSTPPTAPPSTGTFWTEDFSLASSVDRLAIEVHNMIGTPNVRDGYEGGNNPVTFGGDHDMVCGSPATTRSIHEDHTPATHVWWCAPGNDAAKGHLMTGMNTTGYVVIAMTPQANGAPVVFPASADRICWDQNLTNLGGRKWTQLAVISDDRAAAIDTLIVVNPDNAMNAGNSPVAAADDFVFAGTFNAVQYFVGGTRTVNDYSQVDISITDKATRYRTCVIDNGNGTVTRTQARPGGRTVTFTGRGQFPAGPRVFILSDDSYNPDKFAEEKPAEAPTVAEPYTWHWDNITIDGG